VIAVRVELLTGRYAATRFNDRDAAEWPPHPARLFSAMVAAWADNDGPDAAERAVLAWFETLGAPEISASPAVQRSPVTFFVPNNDAAASSIMASQSRNYAKLAETGMALAQAHARLALDPADRAAQRAADKQVKALDRLQEKIRTDSLRDSADLAKSVNVEAGVQLLPDLRMKQGRTFPVMIPHDPVVVFSWPAADPTTEQRELLANLLARVPRLGHSSSMVSCTLTDDTPTADLIPASDGPTVIRVTARGLLDELELSYASHQAVEPRVLPTVLSSYRPRARAATSFPHPYLADDWIVLTDVSEAALPLTRTLDLTKAVRGALLKFADDPLPELLSGHQPAGVGAHTPASERPHLAVVALPFIAREHADSHIRGVGLVLPRDASLPDREAVARAVRRWVDDSGRGHAVVTMGAKGIRRLEVGDQLNPIESLQPRTWCRPAQVWASSTPVALDRHPGGLWSANPDQHNAAEARAIQTISRACEHVGLPQPIQVALSRSGPLVGVPDLGRFPGYRSPGRNVHRQSVHVRLVFDEPVSGPLLIGAGRYFGYGLLRPVGPTRLDQEAGRMAELNRPRAEVAS
jgi:CRISPR-associated protein Csb2